VATEECPSGGLHIWRYDAHLGGLAYLYCKKCGKEVPTEDDD
jgi:hypothetical protein